VSGDYQLEDTLYLPFTTRAFATGIPTTLAGTPVVTGHRDANLTQFTTGITLAADFDSIGGLNMITVVATAANGYVAGETYTLYLSAGTVSSVSVVGEVVAHFTLDMSSAAKDLANGTDGLGAIKAETALIVADTAAILVDTGTTLDTKVNTIDTVVDAIKVVTDKFVFTVANQVDADMLSMATNTAAVNNLTLSTLGIITGATEAGTLSTTQATTDLTGYANDELIGRTIIFVAGDAAGQATDITDYASASGLVTYTAITTLPAAADTFVIV